MLILGLSLILACQSWSQIRVSGLGRDMYLQFSIFWYCFVLVLFCVSLSLSLSLSLLLRLVCSMEPKKSKSTSSRNPLHSGASSSDFTPSHVRFRDDKAHKDFRRTFSQRGIHSECRVVLLDFSNTDLPIVIYSRGWESLCGVPITCLSVIIQEFYSNMHGFDYFVLHFVTRIRGMRIVITSEIVSEVLHVPRVAHPDYPGCKHLRTVSKDKLLSRFYEDRKSVV